MEDRLHLKERSEQDGERERNWRRAFAALININSPPRYLERSATCGIHIHRTEKRMKTRSSIYAFLAMTFLFAAIASTSAIAQSAGNENPNDSAGDPFWDYTSLSIISEEGVLLVVTDDVLAAQVEVVPDSDVPDFGYFAYAVPSLDRQYLRLVEGNIVPWSDEISFTFHTLIRAPEELSVDGTIETLTDNARTYYVVASASGTSDDWVWWECTKAGFCGLGQGVVNIANGLQDTVIGVANIPAAAANGIAWTEEQLGILDPDDPIRVPYIPSPDWSKDLGVPEDDFSHGVSKFSGAAGVEILTGVWIAKIAKFPKVAKLLEKLPGKLGKTGPIKEVPDAKALDDLFDALTDGATAVDPGSYPGIVKKLPDGTVVRKRPGSKSGGATIDITLPDGTYVKVYIK